MELWSCRSFFYAMRWRNASKSIIPVATETFNGPNFPYLWNPDKGITAFKN